MKASRLYILLAVFVLGCDTDNSSNPAYGVKSIPLWDIHIPHDRYISLLNNRWSEEEATATIHIDKKEYTGYVEAQGAGSRYLAQWSYKIELEEGSSLQEMQEFNLSAQVWDKTRIRTPLVNAIYERAGFIGSKSFSVFLRLNNKNQGLYTVIERIEEEYFEVHSEYPLHELIKVGFEATFTFKNGALKLDKSFDKKYPDDDNNYGNLADLIHALDNTPTEDVFIGIGKYLDINQYLLYHALSSLLNHKDGFTNNFYLYKSYREAPYQIIPWDYDQAFSFTDDVEFAGENDIFTKLIENDSCATLYRMHLHNLLDSVVTEEFCFPIIDSIAAEIAYAYSIDPYLGGKGYDVFQEAERLKTYITERRTYFRNILNN